MLWWGDRTAIQRSSPRSRQRPPHILTRSSGMTLRPQTGLSWDSMAWRQPATTRGQQRLLELWIRISNCWLNTKPNQTTKWPQIAHTVTCIHHSWTRQILDTWDLFVSLTGTILTRIYSSALGQLASHFIYVFLLSHLHAWTTACACGCTAIIYIWLQSHKPSV